MTIIKKIFNNSQNQLNQHRLLLLALFLITILMIATLHTKNQLQIHKRTLTDTNVLVQKEKDANNDLKQIIAEKSTETHLKDVAQKNGLSINNNQIKDIKPTKP